MKRGTETIEGTAIAKYSHQKNELLNCIDEMLDIEAIRGCHHYISKMGQG